MNSPPTLHSMVLWGRSHPTRRTSCISVTWPWRGNRNHPGHLANGLLFSEVPITEQRNATDRVATPRNSETLHPSETVLGCVRCRALLLYVSTETRRPVNALVRTRSLEPMLNRIAWVKLDSEEEFVAETDYDLWPMIWLSALLFTEWPHDDNDRYTWWGSGWVHSVRKCHLQTLRLLCFPLSFNNC